jgi:hypothetical protein
MCAGIARAKNGGMTTADWYRLLDGFVFLWADHERVIRQPLRFFHELLGLRFQAALSKITQPTCNPADLLRFHPPWAIFEALKQPQATHRQIAREHPFHPAA